MTEIGLDRLGAKRDNRIYAKSRIIELLQVGFAGRRWQKQTGPFCRAQLAHMEFFMHQQAMQELNERFRRQIPLTDHLGLRISAWDGDRLRMAAPLAPNRNDKGTGFAGSIASLATFAGWALLTLAVEERCGAAQVAVYRSELRYRRPIDGDFEARCCLPDAAQMEEFWQALRDTGRGRLELNVVVVQGDEEKVRYQGAYAVRLVAGLD